jgi:hypothetical protein
MLFKVKDLMINVIPERFLGTTGGASLCADNTPEESINYTPLTPMTPVIMVAKYTGRLQVLDQLAPKIADARLGDEVTRDCPLRHVLEGVAVQVGRAAVAGKFVPGAALCAEDMGTCAANPFISPIASEGLELRVTDLPEVRLLLQEAVRGIEAVEATWEKQTVAKGDEIRPRLESALQGLGG